MTVPQQPGYRRMSESEERTAEEARRLRDLIGRNRGRTAWLALRSVPLILRRGFSVSTVRSSGSGARCRYRRPCMEAAGPLRCTSFSSRRRTVGAARPRPQRRRPRAVSLPHTLREGIRPHRLDPGWIHPARSIDPERQSLRELHDRDPGPSGWRAGDGRAGPSSRFGSETRGRCVTGSSCEARDTATAARRSRPPV
jgi:hypothetical protein